MVGEKARFIDNGTIKLANKGLHVTTDMYGQPTNLSVTINNVTVPIRDWNRYLGEIYLANDVQYVDDILVDYTYFSTRYTYKGYADDGQFYHLDFNPMPGHVYTDNNGVDMPTSDLLDKVIYVYMLPTYVATSNSQLGVSGCAIRHAIHPESKDEFTVINEIKNLSPIHQHMVMLAKVLIRTSNIPKTTTVIDTRRRGGGLSDRLNADTLKSLVADSDVVLDVSSWDGKPYPSNGVGIITLPKSLLVENGGKFTKQQIRDMVNKYLAFGVYAIIRYI